MTYLDFLRTKIQLAPESGFDLPESELPATLKPHQKAAVLWALKGGRRALFESFGLGKTVQQLEWCRQVIRHEGGRALVVLPCKVGDTVWANIAIVGDRYKSADRPYPVEIVFIGMGEDKRFFHVQYSNGRVFPFDFDRVGETIFLTREEAEAALKKEDADNETN